jgi:hypothetical protein
MKRLLPFLLALLASPLLAQPTTSSTFSWSGDTGTFTAAAGDAVVVFGYNFANGPATATLDGNPVPIQLTSSTNWPTIWNSSAAISTVWVVPNLSAGAHTFIITNSGDHFASSVGYDISGTATVNPVEYVAGSVAGTGSSCTGTATTTHTGDLLISTINAAGSPTVSLGTSTQTMTLMGSGGGTPSSMFGVTGSSGAVTAVWNLGASSSFVCDTIALKPLPGTEPTVSSVATSPTSPSVVSNAHITFGATATYSDGGLQNVSGTASTWASATPAVATISAAGIVNPASSGTTNITATFGGITSSPNTVTVTPYTPVPWFVRLNGGTRFSAALPTGQCDGLADVDYPGTGTNQHCAFNDPRFLYSDGVNTGNPSWVIASSDIVTIRGSIADGVTYRIGYQALNNPCGSGLCFGIASDVGDSGIPSPPPGSASQPTIIQGGNAGSCSVQSARTQLHGGWGIGHVIDLYGTQNVTLSCFDITDFSPCSTIPGVLPACLSSSRVVLADYAATGLHFHNNSTGIVLHDIRVHGLSGSGLAGAPGDGFVATDLDIIGNGFAGWNADDNDSTTGVGSLNVTGFNILWNGCQEEYPIVDALPYFNCRDQLTGGYGDGFGTASLNSNPPGWQVHFDQGTVAYNTQDGLDALHIGGTGSTMTETRVLAYGNEGQQLKVGGATGRIQNSIIFGNCDALAKTTLYNPGGPGEFGSEVNSNIATFHVGNTVVQAGDTYEFSGLVNLTGLNGTTATILSAGLSSTQFSVNYTHADTVHGQIQQLYQNQHGAGMTLGTYPVTFTGGGGSGAAGTFQATSATDGIPTITNPGSGYTSNPTVSVAGTGGTPPPIYAQIIPYEQGIATTPIPGRPAVTGDDLPTACRAGNQALYATVSPGFTTSIQDNTIYASGQIGLEIEYADAGNMGTTNVAQYSSNAFLAFPGNSYAQPGTRPNPIFSNSDLNMFSNPGGILSHNSYLNAGHGFVCSTFGTSNVCTDPGLVNETMPPLATVDVTPASGISAIVGSGLFLSAVPLDFSGLTRPNPPSIGAKEFASGPTTPSMIISGPVVFHGVKLQ